MNAAHMMRRFESGGFTHEQASCLAETIAEEVDGTVATREFVELAIERATSRLATAEEVNEIIRTMALRADADEMRAALQNMATKDDIRNMATKDDLKGMATTEFVERVVAEAKYDVVKWIAGIIAVQTVAILAGAVMILKALS
jgi:hypothetical protein